MSISTQNSYTDVAQAVVSRITADLSTADAKECAYAYHDKLCMDCASLCSLDEEMRSHFTIEQLSHLSEISDAFIEVINKLYGPYVSSL
jgi:hypothetical protein